MSHFSEVAVKDAECAYVRAFEEMKFKREQELKGSN
jgi:hypothetical protein